MDLRALAAAHRAASAAAGPADVKNISPSLRKFEHYVSTQRNELAVIAEWRGGTPVAPFVQAAEAAGCYGTCIAAHAEWGGSLADIRAANAVAKMPVLARGIVLDEQDLYRLRDAGADAFVVFAALHDAAALTRLRKAARSMHAEILVQIDDDAGLATALASECALLGITLAAHLAKIPATRVPIFAGAVPSTDAITPLLPQIDAVIVPPGLDPEPFTSLV